MPRIKVTEEDDKEIQDGIITRLPKNKTLIVFSDYDGKIESKKNESIVDQKALKAQTRIFIDNISFGQSIEVWQGLDLLWSVEFVNEKATHSENDELLYNQLISCKGRFIVFPHRFVGVADKLKESPKVLDWLRITMRSGTIREDAVKLLKKVLL